MNRNEENIDAVLRKVLHSTPQQEMEAAGSRVLERLRIPGVDRIETPRVRPVRRWYWTPAAVLTAAAVLVLAVIAGTAWWPRQGFVETAGGGITRVSAERTELLSPNDVVRLGETLRTADGATAIIVLADGSRVEIRAQTELSLEPADDGVQIRLNRGDILVNAAKQRKGHL